MLYSEFMTRASFKSSIGSSQVVIFIKSLPKLYLFLT